MSIATPHICIGLHKCTLRNREQLLVRYPKQCSCQLLGLTSVVSYKSITVIAHSCTEARLLATHFLSF